MKHCLSIVVMLLFQINGAAQTLPPGQAHWEARHYRDLYWETTSNSGALDAEVTAGARILKFNDGTYVHAIHRQYPDMCGPASMAMMLRQLGFAEPNRRPSLPSNVDRLPESSGPTVDAGYVGSMEHLMWIGYHRARLKPGEARWNANDPLLMSPEGELNAAAGHEQVATLAPHGEMDYLDFAKRGRVPNWLWHGKAIGTGADNNTWDGLPGIMNYVVAGACGRGCRDALPLTAFSRSDDEVRAFRRIIKGFIDHNISVLLGIESGKHFNVIIGYRGDTESVKQPFYLYTAEPLDGWGRPKDQLSGRWRRLNAIGPNMFNGSKLIYQYVCWNQHLNGGCDSGGWACEVDQRNGNRWLCGRTVPVADPLRAQTNLGSGPAAASRCHCRRCP